MIFFITLFRYFTIVLFFTLHFFSFSQGMQTRERAHCARSVFPFIRKKKKKTHTWATRWDESGPQLKSRGRENPRGLVSPRKVTGVGGIPRRTSGRWSLSPGMIPREWSSDIPGVRCTIPRNSQRGVVGYQFPIRRQRRSWRPGITPDMGGEWS